jgi:hypothetical protein
MTELVTLEGLNPPLARRTMWRHMSLGKFVSLLETGGLWFSCITELEDRFEGSPTVPSAARRSLTSRSLENFGAPDSVQERYSVDYFQNLRSQVYVNCWYASRYESLAQWQWASRSGDAIAIRTRIGRLRDALMTADRIYTGSVLYLDYRLEEIPTSNPLAAFFCKRKSFFYEREVRLLVARTRPGDVRPAAGIGVPVDLKRLIMDVVVAPRSPSFYMQAVAALVRKYGLAARVRTSTLDVDPIW